MANYRGYRILMVGEVVYTFDSACAPKIGFGDTDIWIVEKLNPRHRDLVTIRNMKLKLCHCEMECYVGILTHVRDVQFFNLKFIYQK